MLGRPRAEDSAATADLRFSPSEVSLLLGADWLQDFWLDREEDFATDPLYRCSAEGSPRSLSPTRLTYAPPGTLKETPA